MRWLVQPFAPLPKRPTLLPLTLEQIRSREPRQPSEDATAQLLEEAQSLEKFREERIKANEAKATTLLGTVAIAGTVAVAGSGLVLDTAKVTPGWRPAVMGEIVALLACLLICALVASRAVMQVWRIAPVQTRAALNRAKKYDAGRIRLARARDTFARATENRYVADFKTSQVRVAYRWFRLSLLLLFAIALTLLIYSVIGAA